MAEEFDFDEEIEGENLDVPEKEDAPQIPKKMAEKEFQSWAEHLRLDTNEDVDFCYRLKANGYRLLNEPELEVFHAGQSIVHGLPELKHPHH